MVFSAVPVFAEKVEIPFRKEKVFLIFDEPQQELDYLGFVVEDYSTGSESALFNTQENQKIAKEIITRKGYRIADFKKDADLLLYLNCKSGEIKSTVTVKLIDVASDREYIKATGVQSAGWDFVSDIKAALKKAVMQIPERKAE